MGNCLAIKDAAPLIVDPKANAKIQIKRPTIYDSCTKKITYIKKHFGFNITLEQQKKINAIEKILKELSSSCDKMGFGEEEQKVCFNSINNQLRRIKNRLQNTSKLTMTDYEVFVNKMEKLGIPKLDIFQIISIPNSRKHPPILSDLDDINFPILSFTNNNLIYLAGLILKNANFVTEQSIKSSKIDTLIQNICLNYNITGYHNFSHGFSVFLMAYQAYNLSSEIRDYLSSMEFFFLLIAAIGHDLNHKGFNNAFHVKQHSQYAIFYSNQSVLQNMHISTLFRLMEQNPEGDLISNLKDASTKARARKIIIRSILATDMTTHFSSLKHFKEKCEYSAEGVGKINQKGGYLGFQKQKQEDRDIIMQNIIHSCDIGNPCLEYKNYMNWAALLTHQFSQQNKKQVLNGYELTPMLQYVDKPTFYKGQIGFCKHFVLPLWKQMSAFSNSLKIFPEQIQKNIEILETMQ